MIKAQHNKYAKFVFDIYLKRLLKSSFKDFWMINSFPQIDDSKSLVVLSNHFSWWDGFFVYWLLNIKLNRKVFIMMLEEQLKRFWFFRKVGCYSINLKDKQSTITSLRYTIEILNSPKNVVVIFPQGEIQPYEKRPVELKEGISFLSKVSEKNFLILPLAFKIHHSNEKNPFIYSRCGQLISSIDIKNDKDLLSKIFTENLDQLDADYLSATTKSIF